MEKYNKDWIFFFVPGYFHCNVFVVAVTEMS